MDHKFNTEVTSESKTSHLNHLNCKWYILKTKSNFEKKVHEKLHAEGYETYLPTYITLRIWSDRKKKIEVPLIPSYVFIRCSSNELLVAAQTNGVAWIMRDGREFAVVHDYEIQNLRLFLSEKVDLSDENLDGFERGETVKVTQGPFTGMIGTAMERHNEYRVRIEITSIGAGFTVSIPKSQLEKVTN